MKKLYIGSDYRGIELRNQIIAEAELPNDIEFIDLGIEPGSNLDYIDISRKIADELYHNPGSIGVVICGSGQGVAIALNRFTHIRAAVCSNPNDASMVREKLDANVLCLGSNYLDLNSSKKNDS